MDDLFERAAAGSGAEYVEAERQLRRRLASGLADAEASVRQGQQSPDPVVRLLAEVVLGAHDPGMAQDHANLEKLFVNLPAHAARTPLGDPVPSAFASLLKRGYGNRATKFLALRLVKEPDWPSWQAVGALLYLQEQKDAAVTAAILRYATLTPAPDRRDLAVKALAGSGDPALASKVADARRWAQARKIPLPPEVAALGGAGASP
jgi:hypothetical protein